MFAVNTDIHVNTNKIVYYTVTSFIYEPFKKKDLKQNNMVQSPYSYFEKSIAATMSKGNNLLMKANIIWTREREL